MGGCWLVLRVPVVRSPSAEATDDPSRRGGRTCISCHCFVGYRGPASLSVSRRPTSDARIPFPSPGDIGRCARGQRRAVTAYGLPACPQARGNQLDGYLLAVYHKSQSRAAIGLPCIQPPGCTLAGKGAADIRFVLLSRTRKPGALAYGTRQLRVCSCRTQQSYWWSEAAA